MSIILNWCWIFFSVDRGHHWWIQDFSQGSRIAIAGVRTYDGVIHRHCVLNLVVRKFTVERYVTICNTSAFNTVVCCHKLCEVENECIPHKLIVFAIFVPNICTVGGYSWQSCDRIILHNFFWSGRGTTGPMLSDVVASRSHIVL